jgi:hypothetical protein
MNKIIEEKKFYRLEVGFANRNPIVEYVYLSDKEADEIIDPDSEVWHILITNPRILIKLHDMLYIIIKPAKDD